MEEISPVFLPTSFELMKAVSAISPTYLLSHVCPVSEYQKHFSFHKKKKKERLMVI